MWISHGDKWASRCTYTDATGLNLEDGVLLMQNRGPDRGHVLVYEQGVHSTSKHDDTNNKHQQT